MNWRAGGVCFQLAEVLHQDGGCMRGTVTDARNLLFYMRWREGKGLIHGKIAQ